MARITTSAIDRHRGPQGKAEALELWNRKLYGVGLDVVFAFLFLVVCHLTHALTVFEICSSNASECGSDIAFFGIPYTDSRRSLRILYWAITNPLLSLMEPHRDKLRIDWCYVSYLIHFGVWICGMASGYNTPQLRFVLLNSLKIVGFAIFWLLRPLLKVVAAICISGKIYPIASAISAYLNLSHVNTGGVANTIKLILPSVVDLLTFLTNLYVVSANVQPEVWNVMNILEACLWAIAPLLVITALRQISPLFSGRASNILSLKYWQGQPTSAKPHKYHTRIVRAKMTIRVPHGDIDELRSTIDSKKARRILEARFSGLCIGDLTVRSGSIIVEVETLQMIATDGSRPEAPPHPSILQVLKDEGLLGDANLNDLPISVQYENEIEVGVFSSAAGGSWSPLHNQTNQGQDLVPLSPEQPRCLPMPESKTLRLLLRTSDAENKLEVVLGGRSLRVERGLPEPHGLPINVDLTGCHPGLVSINLWSNGQPSCLLASQSVLLLPADCQEAANEMSSVVYEAYSKPNEKEAQQCFESLMADFASLIEEGHIPISILLVMASDVLEWARASDCLHLKDLAERQLMILKGRKQMSSDVKTTSDGDMSREVAQATKEITLSQLISSWPMLIKSISFIFTTLWVIKSASIVLKGEGLPTFVSFTAALYPYISISLCCCLAKIASGRIGRMMSTKIHLPTKMHQMLGKDIGLTLMLHRVMYNVFMGFHIRHIAFNTVMQNPTWGALICFVMSMLEPCDIKWASIFTLTLVLPAHCFVWVSSGFLLDKALCLALLMALSSFTGFALTFYLNSRRQQSQDKISGRGSTGSLGKMVIHDKEE